MSEFNYWTVLDSSTSKYKCKCICGTLRIIRRDNLISGQSKSCGCFGLYPGIKIQGFKLISFRITPIAQNRIPTFECKHGVKFESHMRRGKPLAKFCPCERPKVCIKTHGEGFRSKEYGIWACMKNRCLNPKNRAFKNYGNRGISICKSWLKFENFIKDMGRCPRGHSLDRINNDGNYEPKNCRWATRVEQANNRRSTRHYKAYGKIKTLSEWAEEFKINRNTLSTRICRGWPIERALNA